MQVGVSFHLPPNRFKKLRVAVEQVFQGTSPDVRQNPVVVAQLRDQEYDLQCSSRGAVLNVKQLHDGPKVGVISPPLA